MDKLISVIIPVFNRFEHANRSILSVINQTYENWELTVIDDFSGTHFELPKECLNVKQSIKLIRNTSNLGPGLTRQRGLDEAKGEFVSFLDSDDYWLPDFLNKSLMVHALHNFTLGATYVQSVLTDGNLRRRNTPHDAVDDIFYGNTTGVRPWATCSLLWNRKYTAKWSSLRSNQDALFELESAILNPSIVFIPEILCVIDKDTGMNTEDLIEKTSSEANRLKVILKSQKLFKLYRGPQKQEIKKNIINQSFRKIKKILLTKNCYFAIYAVLKTIIFKYNPFNA